MAPVDTSPESNMRGFELIASLKSNDLIPVHQYRSKNTGLTVFIGDVDGPVVYGHFVVVTEVHDDSGLPHTLEHLIFLGSESYPYNGILDLFANRCLASGTNAFTDVDNTTYTMSTAGSEGFLSLIPIYLDHILYPTLKESTFVTEVHHITGEGDNGGVVYCEMQSRENDGEALTYHEMTRAVYPGKCGYKSITGGALKDLRENINNEKVKQYHKEFYRPENLYIVITGQVKHADVFRALQPIEDKIMSKGNRGPFKKPWQDSVPPLMESKDLDVKYPCDEEDNGLVYFGWQGPSAVNELYDLTGCSILLKYLTDTSISPLQQEFVEIDDPYASNVAYSMAENSIALIYVMFMNVPIAKLSQIKDKFLKVLKGIVNKENSIDMTRMHSVINRYILETLSNLESNPHESIAFMIIGHVLYGNTKEDLNKRLNQIDELRKFLKEPASYWINLLKKYFVDKPVVHVKGIPSIERKLELSEQEKQRIKKQIESLGEEGLEQKRKELVDAMAENQKDIPPELLTSIPIPSTDSINFHHIKSFSTDTLEQHPKMDVKKIPFYTYLDHVNTNFVYMFVIMDTAPVPKETRFYIPLLLEAIMESPVKRNGKLIPYEEIVTELEADTVAVSTRLGFNDLSRFQCGAYSHSANFMLQLEMSKYEKGIQWVRELLFETEFTTERLRVIASKIINDVAQMKRKGNFIANELLKGLLYKKESNHYSVNILRQYKFLTKMVERLNSEIGQKEVLAEIESVREILTSSANTVLYLATNVDKLATQVPNLCTLWVNMFPNLQKNAIKSKLKVTPDYQLLNDEKDIPLSGCVTGLGCIESSFFYKCTRSITDYEHPDLAPLLVCLQYLSQLEGPMWKLLRGQGLTYSYDIRTNVHDGLLYLTFYKATNLTVAYKQTKTFIESLLSVNKWERLLFDSAKSSLISTIIEREKSISDTVQQSVLCYFKNVPHDYNRQLVHRISAVAIEDMERVAPKYIKQLFDPKTSWTTAVCHTTKASEIVDNFKQLDHDLKIYTSLEDTYLNTC